ncbi:MAG: hypothetical protein MK212_21300 [Saprospiraceae bacterium]|nr:hypothetical protein [Saprospiraceae bacterium]
MKLKGMIFGLAALFFITNNADAQTRTPKVSKRQVNQQKRIGHGIKSGELTRGEVYRLERQQRDVHRTKRAAKADGVVTGRERAVIHHKQNRASANIYHKKHNSTSR